MGRARKKGPCSVQPVRAGIKVLPGGAITGSCRNVGSALAADIGWSMASGQADSTLFKD